MGLSGVASRLPLLIPSGYRSLGARVPLTVGEDTVGACVKSVAGKLFSTIGASPNSSVFVRGISSGVSVPDKNGLVIESWLEPLDGKLVVLLCLYFACLKGGITVSPG